MKIDMGCGPRKKEGFYGIDRKQLPGVNLVCDCNGPIPLPDNCAEEVNAGDFLEHIDNKNRIHIMDEIWRLLKPGGIFTSSTPSTDGRGAFQDPTHFSQWNQNSFYYYSMDVHRELYGIKAKFEIVSLCTTPMDTYQVCHVNAILRAIKQSSDMDLKFTGERLVGKTLEEVESFPIEGKRHVDRYKWAAERVVGNIILDCACGVGYGSKILCGDVSHRMVAGIDLDPVVIEYAKKYYGDNRIQFEQGNILEMGGRGGFTTIVSLETIEHFKDPIVVLDKFKNMMFNDSHLIVSIPTIRSVHFNPFHLWEVPDFDAGCKFFKNNGFDIKDSWHQDNTYGIFCLMKSK